MSPRAIYYFFPTSSGMWDRPAASGTANYYYVFGTYAYVLSDFSQTAFPTGPFVYGPVTYSPAKDADAPSYISPTTSIASAFA